MYDIVNTKVHSDISMIYDIKNHKFKILSAFIAVLIARATNKTVDTF